LAGDSIQVERLPFVSSNEPEVIKGVVIDKRNKASDSSIMLVNSEYGTPVVRRIKVNIQIKRTLYCFVTYFGFAVHMNIIISSSDLIPPLLPSLL
jgi:hypothetical protein